jgi:cytochrome c-type biogenesis protein CcmH/NrfG
VEGAVEILESLVERHPGYADAPGLLGRIYEETGRVQQALDLYRKFVASEALPEVTRMQFASRITALERGWRE